MDTTRVHRPVPVVADQRVFGEVVAMALEGRGVPATVEPWRAGLADPVPHDPGRVGALLVAADDALALAGAVAFVRRSTSRWLVVTTGPPGPRWGALLHAGACEVEDTTADVDRLVEAVRGVMVGAGSRHLATVGAFRRWAVESPSSAVLLERLTRLDWHERHTLRALLESRSDADVAALVALAAGPDPADRPAVFETLLRTLGVTTTTAAVAAVRRLEHSWAGPTRHG
ncbi:hypothetical protein AB0N29_19405 [Nocardioides sp. NPDC092400]|uniref:hypothetical protein n=1 Tax=Nocardioides sp. NPDC092400 TaxID=3155196 RepID=UPI003431589A